MIKLIFSINLFLISVFGFFGESKTENQPMTICQTIANDTMISSAGFNGVFTDSPIDTDPNKSYTLPSLTKNTKGEVVLYWTEKDPQNVVSLCFATSKDGETYGEKKTIFADAGLGSSRLARPKLLFKKNGEMVAVFTYRTTSTPPVKTDAAAPKTRPVRSSEIRFTVSKDGGNTWTEPTSVDKDPTKLTRGFFDAVLLANDEIAVAYLKDVKGSTKHEERDLRLAVTKKGVFQTEKLIDAVVCDCCNISMNVDDSGALHMVYRDNYDNVRDMSHIVSQDNGATFSAPKTLYADNWKINGCPHAGATMVSVNNKQYATWFSGTEDGQSGVRLVDSSGKLLKVLDSSVRNANLVADDKTALWIWEERNDNELSNVFYSKIVNGKLLDSKKIADSDYGQNASGLLFNGKVLVAYEVLQSDKKTVLATKILE